MYVLSDMLTPGDRAEAERAFQDVLDQAIVFHESADQRDDDLYLHATADPRTLIRANTFAIGSPTASALRSLPRSRRAAGRIRWTSG